MKNKCKMIDDTVIININSKYGNYECFIDKEDFDKVNQFNTSWYLIYNKGRIESVVTKIQKGKVRKSIKLHTLLTSPPKNLVVDHIDGNVLNNKKSNLRIITAKENATNLKDYHTSSSGYQNIYFEKGKYAVRIKSKRYGRYNTIEEAVKVRNKIVKEQFPLRQLPTYMLGENANALFNMGQ